MRKKTPAADTCWPVAGKWRRLPLRFVLSPASEGLVVPGFFWAVQAQLLIYDVQHVKSGYVRVSRKKKTV